RARPRARRGRQHRRRAGAVALRACDAYRWIGAIGALVPPVWWQLLQYTPMLFEFGSVLDVVAGDGVTFIFLIAWLTVHELPSAGFGTPTAVPSAQNSRLSASTMSISLPVASVIVTVPPTTAAPVASAKVPATTHLKPLR